MSVASINDHVLLWFAPDWNEPPEWSRAWQNEIADAVTGKESRFALRHDPRITLSWSVAPKSLVNTAMLDDAVREAKKTSLACCPYHGRGAHLNTAVVALTDTIEVRANGFTWQAGDFVFIRPGNDYIVAEVETASESAGVWTLVLDTEVENLKANKFVWPLLFGKFSCDEMPALTTKLGTIRVTVSERTSRSAAQLGEVEPVAGSGIGAMVVADDFTVT